MPNTQRVTFLVLVIAAVVGGIIDASVYAVAFTSLGRETSPAGFDTLALANHLVVVVAAVAALAVIVRTFGAKRLAVPAFSLLLISGVTALIAGGLWNLGTTFFHIANQMLRDDPGAAVSGSSALHLSSLMSGVFGSGYDLAPVPVVFVIAAALVLLIPLARRAFAHAAVSGAAEVVA